MTKAFDKIAEGLREALQIARGVRQPAQLHVPPEIEWERRRHECFKRLAEETERRSLEAHGRLTPTLEPPGDGDWKVVAADMEAFADAGLCELWRADQGDKTAFFRHSDFPPGFNFSGMWWRKV